MISNNFVTKSLVFKEDSGERFFEGLLTVEMIDKQGEVTMVDSLYKCLPIWMDRGGAISDTHSNRIVGKGINYSKTTLTDKEGNTLPALKIIGKIFNHTQLDNEIWQKIKSGEYKGLSFGGATTSDAEPVQQSDGSIAFHLKDIEMYEIAVCEDPAVPFALITATNEVAKSMVEKDDYVAKDDEDVIIKCEEKGCFISKADDKKPLNKPMRDDGDKKFKVYVKDPKTGKTVTVRFGDPNMEIRRDDPEARASFRARHKCDQQKDKTSAAYWSCKMWEEGSTVTDNTNKSEIKKPLPTKWGDVEFDKCEERARNDDEVRNPEAYCGSIQNTVEGAKKTDDIGKEVRENKDDKFSSQKPLGVNAQDDKDLKEIRIAKSDHRFYCFDCGLAKNHNDSGSTINAQDEEDIKEVETAKGTMHVQSEGLTKPKDDGKELDFEHKEGCPCKKESSPGQGGVRALGAGNTAQQGSGESAQVSEEKEKACWEGYTQSGMKEQDGKMVPNCVPNSSEKADDPVNVETLGNPDRLKKPGNITQDRPSSMKCNTCGKCSKCGKTKTI